MVWRGDALHAKSFSDPPRSITPAHLSKSWYAIISLPPFKMSPEQAREADWTPYGTRHLHPDHSRSIGDRVSLRQEYGRWDTSAVLDDVPIHARDPRKCNRRRRLMANQYSRAEAALYFELCLRLRLIRMVRTFIGDSFWSDRIPLEYRFDFLPQAAVPDDVVDPILEFPPNGVFEDLEYSDEPAVEIPLSSSSLPVSSSSSSSSSTST